MLNNKCSKIICSCWQQMDIRKMPLTNLYLASSSYFIICRNENTLTPTKHKNETVSFSVFGPLWNAKVKNVFAHMELGEVRFLTHFSFGCRILFIFLLKDFRPWRIVICLMHNGFVCLLYMCRLLLLVQLLCHWCNVWK